MYLKSSPGHSNSRTGFSRSPLTNNLAVRPHFSPSQLSLPSSPTPSFKHPMISPREMRFSRHGELPSLSRFGTFSPSSTPVLNHLPSRAQRRRAYSHGPASTPRFSPRTSLSCPFIHSSHFDASTRSVSGSLDPSLHQNEITLRASSDL